MRRTLAAGLLAAALALPAAQAVAHASTATGAPTRAGTVKPRSDCWEARVSKLTNARARPTARKPLKAGRCPDGFAEPWTRHLAHQASARAPVPRARSSVPAHVDRRGEHRLRLRDPARAGSRLDALGGPPGQHPEPALPPDRGLRAGAPPTARRTPRRTSSADRPLRRQVSSSVSSRRRTTTSPISAHHHEVDHRDRRLPA